MISEFNFAPTCCSNIGINDEFIGYNVKLGEVSEVCTRAFVEHTFRECLAESGDKNIQATYYNQPICFHWHISMAKFQCLSTLHYPLSAPMISETNCIHTK